METEIFSSHPLVRAIIAKTAPPAARVAAAKGILPIAQTDLLEALVFIARDADGDRETAQLAVETLAAISTSDLLAAVNSTDIAPPVLNFLAASNSFDATIHEAVIVNPKTSDTAILEFSKATTRGDLLELVLVNQNRLIQNPAILDAVLANPARTSEAERRAKETRAEFFEKSRGAQQVADELRARGNTAAAEFLESAEFIDEIVTDASQGLTLEDAILLASHIEVPDDEVDDSWLGFDLIEQLYEESDEQRRALVDRIINESLLDGEAAPERIALIRRIMLMKTKDRVKLGMKGDREARTILIRDSNKIVAQAVLNNSRITENEIEKITAMRTVPDEILRQIGNNRNWTRIYSVIHNLVRNPRTPLATSMTILTRIQKKDLQAIAKNRNVSEGIRKQAFRMLETKK